MPPSRGHARIARPERSRRTPTRHCVYAKNLVASAIKDIVTAYRAANPDLAVRRPRRRRRRHPVLPVSRPERPRAGEELPAAGRSDQRLGGIAPRPTTSSARTSTAPGSRLSLGAYAFPIPDLPVGRLVETRRARRPGSCAPTSDHTTNGVVAPNNGAGWRPSTRHSSPATTSSPTRRRRSATRSTTGRPRADSRIDVLIRQHVDRTRSEVGPDREPPRPDVPGRALQLEPGAGGRLHHDRQRRPTCAASSSVDLTNSIVFSAGCHSGYNLVDGDQLTNVSQPLDWAQAFARKGATLIAGTGYQYGDSDFELWSERIYAEFAHQLRVGHRRRSTSVGAGPIEAALSRHRRPTIQPMDAKALLQATMYGLPMLSVDLPRRGPRLGWRPVDRSSDSTASGRARTRARPRTRDGPAHDDRPR